MSGNIKVAGTWRNASNLYVKVGGTWRSAVQAYVNVAGSWRIWYNTTISDTFTRANTTTGLGSTEAGGIYTWNSLIGNFYVSGGTATSANTVSAGVAGAISYITLNTPNATVAVGGQTTTSGVGPVVWVSAAGSWWAAIGYNGQTNTTYTYNCNCTCNGHSVTTCNYCSNASFGTSTGTGFYAATVVSTATPGTDVYAWVNSGGSPVVSSYTTGGQVAAATISYSCPNGGVSGGGGNSAGSCYANSPTTTYSCPSNQYLQGTNCYLNSNDRLVGSATATTVDHWTYVSAAVQTFSCSGITGSNGYATTPCGGNNQSCCSQTPVYSSTCSDGSTYRSGVCQNYVYQYTTAATCPSGGTLYFNNCVSCPSGGSFTGGPSGQGCYYSYSYNNNCPYPAGDSRCCPPCSTTTTPYSGGTANPLTGAGCDSYGFTCQTCTGGSITTNYYMQVINSTTTGSAYTVYSTSADYGTQISNISVTTSNNTLTATAYGTTGSVLGTLTATNSGAKGSGVGLVKAYSPYNQATYGDNFSASAGALVYVPVQYLVVGGGGGGGQVSTGSSYSGGGGAGGLLTGTVNINVGAAQTITLGQGGASGGPFTGNNPGSNGGNSVFGSFTSFGGGGGGSGTNGYTYSSSSNGLSGGSGGGGPTGGGAGTAGQGYAGDSSGMYAGGASGGGGAGGVGTDTSGGPGVSSNITGTTLTYGVGGPIVDVNATNNIANSGNGGGGGYYQSRAPQAGSSGVVVVSYSNSYAALSNISAGLTYTYNANLNGNRVYKFTAGTGTVTF